MISITHNERTLAIILPAGYNQPGVHFFTPGNYSQQLAFMRHKTGHTIRAHRHKDVKREVFKTLEVLVIRKGKLRVDFYESDGSYLESYLLRAGDTILLVSGGHGFEVIEEVEMVEIKQGPYAGDQDKCLLKNVDRDDVVLKNYGIYPRQYPEVQRERAGRAAAVP